MRITKLQGMLLGLITGFKVWSTFERFERLETFERFERVE